MCTQNYEMLHANMIFDWIDNSFAKRWKKIFD